MDAADEARILEEELEDDPEDRDDLLLEAARAWQRAGEHNRAIWLLREAVMAGGEVADAARVVLAGVLFDAGQDDEAWAELDALRKSWAESPQTLHDAALLMEKRGEPEKALIWYDLAVAREDPDELADSCIAVGRRQVRRKLGLPEDDQDAEVEPLERRLDDVLRQAGITGPPDPPR